MITIYFCLPLSVAFSCATVGKIVTNRLYIDTYPTFYDIDQSVYPIWKHHRSAFFSLHTPYFTIRLDARRHISILLMASYTPSHQLLRGRHLLRRSSGARKNELALFLTLGLSGGPIVVEDLNTRVRRKNNDLIIGRRGGERLNEIGRWLIQVSKQSLKALDGYFLHKQIRAYTWQQNT